MKGFNFATVLSRNTPWTCQNCTRQTTRRIPSPLQSLRFSTKAKVPKPKRRRNLVLAAAGGATGIGALAFTDDIRHSYQAVERTGRVVGTLAVCINEYVHGLSTRPDMCLLTESVAIGSHSVKTKRRTMPKRKRDALMIATKDVQIER